MDEWLTAARARLAHAVGGAEGDYDLGDDDVRHVLELARIAAHDSGQRINAPLLAYLVGLAHGRHGDRSLAELVEAAGGGKDQA